MARDCRPNENGRVRCPLLRPGQAQQLINQGEILLFTRLGDRVRAFQIEQEL